MLLVVLGLCKGDCANGERCLADVAVVVGRCLLNDDDDNDGDDDILVG